MKSLMVTFENDEWELLIKAKGEETWRKFLISLAESRLKAKPQYVA